MTNRFFVFLLVLIFYINGNYDPVVSEFIETGSFLNDCGGDRILLRKINDLCATNIEGGCPIGNIICYDKNTLMCVPNCTITIESILNQQQSKEVDCFNGGIYDSTLKKCKCLQRYSGNQCQIIDPCLNVDCGSHGHCMNGQCVCDFMFAGDRCQVNQDCQSINKIWTGDQCICQEGYEGDNCDVCTKNLICVPEKHGLVSYAPIIIADEDFLRDVIAWSSPPGYTTKPYLPSPTMKNGCKCTPDFSAVSQPSSSLISHFALPTQRNVEERSSISRHSDYLHHFYRHHYIRPEDCDFSSYFFFVAMLAVVFIILMLILCFCIFRKSSSRSSSILVPVNQKPPSSPILTSERSLQQPQATNWNGVKMYVDW
jgi:hypothetical protein